MPYFHFDLVIDEQFKDQGGMILEDTQVASSKGREKALAGELSVVRPDLRLQEVAPFASPTTRTGNSIGLPLILSHRG